MASSGGSHQHKPSKPRFDCLAGGGEMGALIRAYDWESSPLGPPDGWPCSLKTTLRLLLASGQPMILWWGDDLIQFYNDAYLATGAADHPAALGKRARDCWKEIWAAASSLQTTTRTPRR
jgi:hypothetical protein